MGQIHQYKNESLCASCKSICCTKYAGIFAPDDFEHPITQELIIALLLTKMVALDFDDTYMAASKIYYVRPRHVDEDPVFTGTLQGTCSNWVYNKGCSLSDREKPYQCRMLIPLYKQGYACYYDKRDKADKDSMLERWMPYQATLRIARKKYLNIAHLNLPELPAEATFFEKITDRLNLVNTSREIQDNFTRELLP